ncbi:concanavalin A-like lectin/glucanase domain-containing protein [Xylaria palmicola]|nr:concanavalin A-like lectin/glucanase domain-containing protein [Xylaria palmicola]
MSKRHFTSLLTTLGLAAQLVNGQLQPDCNPLDADCPAKKAWPEDNYYIDFTKERSPPKNWVIANSQAVGFTTRGAEFAYAKGDDAPNMWTDFYMLGGRYDVEMQVAPGQGIISSSVLLSDIEDEIDWEFSGNQHGQKPFLPPDGKWTTQTNIFTRGQMWEGAAAYNKGVSNPTTQFHTYSVEWDENHVNWYVDNQIVRSVQASTIPSGFTFPQTPMKLQLGAWGGGDPDNNKWTIDWAGGEIDLKGAPYTMYVRSVNITNKYPACQYKYKDRIGKITSIDKIQDGCRSSSSTASTSTTPKIVKNNPAAETPTPKESIKEDPPKTYPVDGFATSQSTSALSSASSAASSESSPSSGTGGYPVASRFIGYFISGLLQGHTFIWFRRLSSLFIGHFTSQFTDSVVIDFEWNYTPSWLRPLPSLFTNFFTNFVTSSVFIGHFIGYFISYFTGSIVVDFGRVHTSG